MPTHIAEALDEVARWPVEDQLEFISQAWDRLVESGWQPELTEELKAELDRRLDTADANPQNSMTWEEIVENARRPR